MTKKKNDQGTLYHILLKEPLKAFAADWFGGITTLHQENGETLLTGRFPDQAALRGFMNQLWDFNYTVLYLKKVESWSDISIKIGPMLQTNEEG